MGIHGTCQPITVREGAVNDLALGKCSLLATVRELLAERQLDDEGGCDDDDARTMQTTSCLDGIQPNTRTRMSIFQHNSRLRGIVAYNTRTAHRESASWSRPMTYVVYPNGLDPNPGSVPIGLLTRVRNKRRLGSGGMIVHSSSFP
jgi:hypothetical protein